MHEMAKTVKKSLFVIKHHSQNTAVCVICLKSLGNGTEEIRWSHTYSVLQAVVLSRQATRLNLNKKRSWGFVLIVAAYLECCPFVERLYKQGWCENTDLEVQVGFHNLPE